MKNYTSSDKSVPSLNFDKISTKHQNSKPHDTKLQDTKPLDFNSQVVDFQKKLKGMCNKADVIDTQIDWAIRFQPTSEDIRQENTFDEKVEQLRKLMRNDID